MAIANFNYLDRKKIKTTKHFSFAKHQGESQSLMVEVKLDKSLLSFASKSEVLRLEAFSKGIYFSEDLEASDKLQLVEVVGFHKKDRPRFRIYSVSNLDRSRIIRASAEFGLKGGKGKKKKTIKQSVPAQREGFFDFAYADIGANIYQLRWDGGLEIVISERLEDMLHDELHTNASFRASFLPSLIKEILIGIVIRHESIIELDGKKKDWIEWANELNLSYDDIEYPSVGFTEEGHGVSNEWLAWCDTCYENFCSSTHFAGESYIEGMVSNYVG